MSILSGFKSYERYIKTDSGYQLTSERQLAKDVLMGTGSGNSVETEIANLKTEMTELGESVADGKASVASAITAKGVTTASDASFDTMASNIGSISTGAKLLYAGDVSIKGNTGSSGSTASTGSVSIGTGLSNVKCAATLKNISTYASGAIAGGLYGSCTYNSETGNVTISFSVNNGLTWYGYGGGTVYLIVIQE